MYNVSRFKIVTMNLHCTTNKNEKMYQFTPPTAMSKNSCCATSYQNFLSLDFKICIVRFLMWMNIFEHFLVIFDSFSAKCLLTSFAHFFNWVVYILIFVGLLYIFWILIPCQLCALKISSPIHGGFITLFWYSIINWNFNIVKS
jgi:hypothetical protein